MTPRPRSFGYARTRTRQSALAAAAIAAALLLAACGSGGGTPSKTSVESASTGSKPASASTSPTPSAAEKAKTQVLAAYQGFWNIQVEAYTSGSLTGLPVNTYALGQAFYDIKSTLQYYNSQNLVMRGRPTLSPVVSSISLAKEPYSATITDCIDTAKFLPVDKTTGKPAKLTDSVFRHPWTFTASFDNVQWRIMTGKIDRTRSC